MNRTYKYKRKASLNLIIMLIFMAVILELLIVCVALVISGSGSGVYLLMLPIVTCGVGILSIVVKYTKVFKIDKKGIGLLWLRIPYKTLRWDKIQSVGIIAYKKIKLACLTEAKIVVSYSQEADVIMYGHDADKTLFWPITKWHNTVFVDYSEEAVSLIQYYYGDITDYREIGT